MIGILKKQRVRIILLLSVVIFTLVGNTTVLASRESEDNEHWYVEDGNGIYTWKISKPHKHRKNFKGDPVNFKKVEHINVLIQTPGYVTISNFHIWKEGKCIRWWDSRSNLQGKACNDDWKTRLKAVTNGWKEKAEKIIDALPKIPKGVTVASLKKAFTLIYKLLLILALTVLVFFLFLAVI